jgi:hypothetical protein
LLDPEPVPLLLATGSTHQVLWANLLICHQR